MTHEHERTTAVALIFKKWGWTADIVQSDYGEELTNSRQLLSGEIETFYAKLLRLELSSTEVDQLGDLRLDLMLRCAVLSFSADTAFRRLREPGLRSPLGSGAGPILSAGCSDKLSASLSKNAWRSG